jgi:hypothetical protein
VLEEEEQEEQEEEAMFVEWCSDKVDSIYRTFYL